MGAQREHQGALGDILGDIGECQDGGLGLTRTQGV